MNEINSCVTMMLSCGWGGRTRRSGGKPPGISWRDGGGAAKLPALLEQLSQLSSSKKGLRSADCWWNNSLTFTLPGTCQTPVGQFCSPAKGHTWKRRNLQTCLGNFCYGERELTFESYTWAGLGSRSSLQLQLDRDPGDQHKNQMRDDLHVSTWIC